MRPRGITRGNDIERVMAHEARSAGFNEAAGNYPRKPPARNPL